MADISIGTMTFIDAESNLSTTRVKVRASKTKAALDILAAALDLKSTCGLSAVGYVDKSDEGGTPAGNKDYKAIITCMDEYRDVHKWQIPGYSGTKAQDKDGEHVIDPDLSTIVAAFATYTGYTLTPLRSPIIQTR